MPGGPTIARGCMGAEYQTRAFAYNALARPPAHRAHARYAARVEIPRVLNRHHFESSAKIPKPWVYVGRGTPLGNPYTVDKYGVERCMTLYRKWLWDKIEQNDPKVLEALAGITPEHGLVCSCAPKPCHADVIIVAWQWCHEQGVFYEEQERIALRDASCH